MVSGYFLPTMENSLFSWFPEAWIRNDPGQVCLAKQAKLSFACMTKLVWCAWGIFRAGLHLFLIFKFPSFWSFSGMLRIWPTRRTSFSMTTTDGVRLKNHIGGVSTSWFTGQEDHVVMVLVIYVVIVDFIQVPHLHGYPLACECRQQAFKTLKSIYWTR